MRERIIGGGHHETHYFIRYRGAVYCDLGETNRCFQLWMHALHLQVIVSSQLSHFDFNRLK